jgi:hypothetical protein
MKPKMVSALFTMITYLFGQKSAVPRGPERPIAYWGSVATGGNKE